MPIPHRESQMNEYDLAQLISDLFSAEVCRNHYFSSSRYAEVLPSTENLISSCISIAILKSFLLLAPSSVWSIHHKVGHVYVLRRALPLAVVPEVREEQYGHWPLQQKQKSRLIPSQPPSGGSAEVYNSTHIGGNWMRQTKFLVPFLYPSLSELFSPDALRVPLLVRTGRNLRRRQVNTFWVFQLENRTEKVVLSFQQYIRVIAGTRGRVKNSVLLGQFQPPVPYQICREYSMHDRWFMLAATSVHRNIISRCSAFSINHASSSSSAFDHEAPDMLTDKL